MLFNIEFDHGDSLEGYIIPDGFSDVASVRIVHDGSDLGTFPCDQPKPAVVASGRHETGLVGFRIDSFMVPDLRERQGLSVHDAKTGLLIYRRPQVPNPIRKKILRLETQLLPMIKLDRYCGYHFQYELLAVERLGHESALQAFHLNAVDSIWLSGRLLMRNYEEFLDKGFQAVVLLSDPYYEMALRIFLLKRLTHSKISFLGERDRLILGPAAEYFAEVNLEHERELRAALKKAPSKVLDVLSSPVTRQLVASTPEQRPSRRDIAPAIDLLSRFAIVGHKRDLMTFQQALSEFLDLPADELIIPPQQALLEELADVLRAIPSVETILEEDLIFDHYVRQAMTISQASMRVMDPEQHDREKY